MNSALPTLAPERLVTFPLLVRGTSLDAHSEWIAMRREKYLSYEFGGASPRGQVGLGPVEN
jgi:hypothetical protein